MKAVTVKSGSVVLTVRPWKHPSGREYWRASYHCPVTRKRRQVTRATLADAKEAAFKEARQISMGELDLATLSDHQKRAIRRILEADPNLDMVDDFLVYHKSKAITKGCRQCVTEFLAAKEHAKGASGRNLETLRGHLATLPDMPLALIRPTDLPPLTGAPRTRENRRNAWITFFSWCRDMELLPHGVKTAPEKLERPKVVRGIPTTLNPDELRVLLENVSPEYLPWLALSAFAGLRNSELSPVVSSKPPLDWSDINWDRRIITVRPETAKTGTRRIIPINAALEAWLRPVARHSGPVCPKRNPTRRGPKGAESETVRLGKLIGGWRDNALRHSFISYRAAQVGLAKTAMEAGNSESEARKSYNDAKGEDEANEWFAVMPALQNCYFSQCGRSF